MNVRTNNVPRDILNGYELTADERMEFDYYAWPDVQASYPAPTTSGLDATFFRYRDELYDLGEFTACEHIPGWDGIQTDTFFSGTVVRFVDDGERIVVGRVYS